MKNIALATLNLVCLSTICLNAQELPKLSENLEARIKANEPSWKLAHKRFEDEVCMIGWQSSGTVKGADVWAVIKSLPSVADAAKELTKGVSSTSIGYSAKLLGIGEEAYLWKGGRSNRVSMQFRRLNVVVNLVAPSEDQAKRFAKHIIDSIPAKAK